MRGGSVRAGRQAVTHPLFRADLDRLLRDADEARRLQAETAKHWAKFAGLPVTEWKATDLVGKEHLSATIAARWWSWIFGSVSAAGA